MNKFLLLALVSLTSISCSNSSEHEAVELKAIDVIRKNFISSKAPKVLLDTRKIITRKKIDNANVAVLLVELENGQNGTLTPYPGQGVGSTWLGADGATITLDDGKFKATRGMSQDLMGSNTSMPEWSDIKQSANYMRTMFYLDGNNQIYSQFFNCNIKKSANQFSINIMEVEFRVKKYDETCSDGMKKISNVFMVDNKGTVRRSLQYHGPALGYVKIERLDR